jgi:hypothetical protein
VTGQTVSKELLKSEDRKADLALHRDITVHDGLSEDESDAFGDMYQWLEDASIAILSDKQRKWAEEVPTRLGVSFARRTKERAENVPRGKEVTFGGVLGQDSLKAALAARKR